MQLSPPLRPSVDSSKKSNFDRIARTGDSGHASAEIGAYIAIRDRLLTDAEHTCTDSLLDRAEAANEFVASCVRRCRSPYEAQHLPEADAARERERCARVAVRIERLRTRLAHAA